MGRFYFEVTVLCGQPAVGIFPIRGCKHQAGALFLEQSRFHILKYTMSKTVSEMRAVRGDAAGAVCCLLL